jgi:hypothetical protein
LDVVSLGLGVQAWATYQSDKTLDIGVEILKWRIFEAKEGGTALAHIRFDESAPLVIHSENDSSMMFDRDRPQSLNVLTQEKLQTQ